MNLRTVRFFTAGLLVAATFVELEGQTDKPDAVSFQRLNSTTKRVDAVLAKQSGPAPLPAGLVNPFNPGASAKSAEDVLIFPDAQSGEGASDRDRLIALADSVNPSGTVMLGGEYILLVNQKKFRVGDVIPIVHRGVAQQLTLVGITRTSFSIRLGSEEVTRPIKPKY